MVGKVDRRDSLSEENNIVVAVGVAPTISALRFPEELPATRLRPSAITNNQNLSQQKPDVKSIGEQLAELDSKIWNELGIESGSDFTGHPEKIKSYASSIKATERPLLRLSMELARRKSLKAGTSQSQPILGKLTMWSTK
ncbi:MAG: hypothetical protein J6Y60_05825 [Treponema sp.]|nr:hypothetical protein [Treponema sp.]